MAARRLGHADWRNVRPRSAGRDVPRVEAVDLFRHFNAAEHAGRRIVSSERHGDFLGERGKGRKRRLARTRGDSAGSSVLESGRRWKHTLVLLRQPSIPRQSKFQVPQQVVVIVRNRLCPSSTPQASFPRPSRSVSLTTRPFVNNASSRTMFQVDPIHSSPDYIVRLLAHVALPLPYK